MRALALTSRDATPEVVDVPDPALGSGEARVAVEAASVNGFDLAVASGRMWATMPQAFPVVLGRDYAGTIEELGAGAAAVAVGDRVMSTVHAAELGPGAIAETVTADAASLVRVPAAVTSEQAAAIGLAGIAALDAVDALDVVAGDLVLVSGATGGVGALAVQLAVARGATVIGTARPGEQAEAVRGFGATYVVDFVGDLAAAVRGVAPDGVTKVLHAAGDPTVLAGLLVPGGRLASLLGADASGLGRDDITVTPVLAATTADKLVHLLDLVAAGRLTVPVAETYPLEKAADALDAFRGAAVGKIVVTV
jgi:NADPH:quinone reductase-like Zn-dependent oxidoreductase